ncbi:hypothetical protein BDN70DRAFT_932276 [Pholiota conissans]|uniref:Brr2 N-terminal helicase PWI domain-containing protein n=1 Tax=Pholiota conissans TaxID=109636 RepID=A0A9P5Z4D6_9AGAR|nr:hypothetical protein BDN70DRAFT_932276 [Pholiota conissans]
MYPINSINVEQNSQYDEMLEGWNARLEYSGKKILGGISTPTFQSYIKKMEFAALIIPSASGAEAPEDQTKTFSSVARQPPKSKPKTLSHCTLSMFWVQRQISEVDPDPVTAANKAVSILSIISSESSTQDCEFQLQVMELFGASSFPSPLEWTNLSCSAHLLVPETTVEFDHDTFKCTFIVPMKALVREMVRKFTARLRVIPKSRSRKSQILVVTPEKWDHQSRPPHHYRRDSSSAWRMWPNYQDIATFLRLDKKKGLFYVPTLRAPTAVHQYYGEGYQAVQLMNEVCYEKVLHQAGKNQTLVFIHSRKETAKTAQFHRSIPPRYGDREGDDYVICQAQRHRGHQLIFATFSTLLRDHLPARSATSLIHGMDLPDNNLHRRSISRSPPNSATSAIVLAGSAAGISAPPSHALEPSDSTLARCRSWGSRLRDANKAGSSSQDPIQLDLSSPAQVQSSPRQPCSD